MQSRSHLLSTLSVVTELPENVDPECAICTDEYTSPVLLPCKHIYCRVCIREWLSMRDRNTCPSCREVLFDANLADRGPTGDERVQLIAQAFQHSGLLGEQYDEYNDELQFEALTVRRAAASAYQYLAEEEHAPLTDRAVVHMGLLGPHIIAMANLIRGYAQAAGRPYSGYQCRDWKLIMDRLIDLLLLANGQIRTDGDVVRMAREYRQRVKLSLIQDLIDTQSGRFFEPNAHMESPCGDLDVLLNYIVAKCVGISEEREAQRVELLRDQQEALQQESTRIGYGMRWLGQSLFGGV